MISQKSAAEQCLTTARLFVNTFFHQIILVICVYFLFILDKYAELEYEFWHGTLCTVAFIPLMAQGILLLSTDTTWSAQLHIKYKKWLHALFLGTSVILLVTGIVLMYDGRAQRNKDHFDNAHAIIGLISACCCLAAMVEGWILMFIKSFDKCWSWDSKLVAVKICHICLSHLGFELGMVSLYLSLDDDPMNVFIMPSEITLCKIAIIFIIVYVMISPFLSLYRNVKNILKG